MFVCGALGSGKDTSMGACDASPFVNVVAIAWGVVVRMMKRRGAFSRRSTRGNVGLYTYHPTHPPILRHIQAYINLKSSLVETAPEAFRPLADSNSFGRDLVRKQRQTIPLISSTDLVRA